MLGEKKVEALSVVETSDESEIREMRGQEGTETTQQVELDICCMNIPTTSHVSWNPDD